MKKDQPTTDKRPRFDQKTADKNAAPISPITGMPMLRAHRIEPVTVAGVDVYVRAQYWEDQHTGELIQDTEQAQCKIDAARLAAESNAPKTVYHTRGMAQGIATASKKKVEIILHNTSLPHTFEDHFS